MFLFFVRHADAVPVGEPGVTTDEERPLSAKGLDQARLLATAPGAGCHWRLEVTDR